MVIAWKKTKIINIKETIPLISKLTIENLKNNFDENGQTLLNNLNGTIGIAVKLFGQQIIDNYFQKITDEKLSNFGIGIYFKAACEQAETSLKNIEHHSLDFSTRKDIFDRFEEIFRQKQNSISSSDLILDFTPRRHPAVCIVREICVTILEEQISNDSSKQEAIDSFIKDFNSNIEGMIVSFFGEDYEKHIKEIEEKWTKSSEGKLLNDMLKLQKIGFAQNEDLKYQETYAYWKKVDDYRNTTDIDNKSATDIKKFEEEELFSIDKLIEDYFENEEDSIEKALFIIADFGKGKSVFLKHKAYTLAKRYEQRGEGFIPVYFNLRDFDTYDQGSSYGIISDFLGKKYGIDVQNEEFQKNQYFYLIDSLDECGNLTEDRIDKVIMSIKKIQNINITKCRQNRLIITSRPIEHGLQKHLNSNRPFIMNNAENRPISHFISIYGFKREQFNDSIMDALGRAMPLNPDEYTGISKNIIEAIRDRRTFDIYQELLEVNLLTNSELRRPIFAYMLYKLILSKANLSYSNKVGVYLSFINVLTKEAKYIDAIQEINLKDEYKFRNILHSTSALWMYETHRRNQGFLKKQDISNTIEGMVIDKEDHTTMKKYEEVVNVEFISQSYFGQKGDTFYFQHQSFAEILLAEYYLKVFIHYALDEASRVDDVRIRLILGNPTEQTIDFLIGLINLLRESVSSDPDDFTIHKRKLLFPMLASLCISDFSKGLFSQHLKFKWFDNFIIDKNTTEPPAELLNKWAITKEVIEKIISLACNIINSKTKFLLTKVNSYHSSLFNNEVVQINDDLSNIPPDIDRWISFLMGNYLYNNENKKLFFSSKFTENKIIFDMMKNWNYFFDYASPTWGRNLFRGMIMSYDLSLEEESYKQFEDIIHGSGLSSFNYINGYNFEEMDFSHSVLSNLLFSHCNFLKASFIEAKFVRVTFSSSNMRSSSFRKSTFNRTAFKMCRLDDIEFNDIKFTKLTLEICEIVQGVFIPQQLSAILKGTSSGLADFGGKSFISTNDNYKIIPVIFQSIEPLIKWILRKGFSNIEEINSWFIFESNNDKETFYKLLEHCIHK